MLNDGDKTFDPEKKHLKLMRNTKIKSIAKYKRDNELVPKYKINKIKEAFEKEL
jgi:hypothetical protein